MGGAAAPARAARRAGRSPAAPQGRAAAKARILLGGEEEQKAGPAGAAAAGRGDGLKGPSRRGAPPCGAAICRLHRGWTRCGY